jgi:3-dehydroquinate synthase
VAELYGQAASDSLARAGFEPTLLTVEPGEESKSLRVLGGLYDRLAELRMERKCLIVALGGGMVGDLAGFAAATWLRGVPFVQVPTTLLAAIDASVGGKTAVNHPAGKNLVGAFYQPRAVVIDVACLRTLDPRDVRSGLAESVKHGVIRDADFFVWQQQRAKVLLGHDQDVLAELVVRNCQIKADVVKLDERESGLRQVLNFGHTIGHAIESECAYQLRHGESVGLGMLAANHIAVGRDMLDADAARQVADVLACLGLPVRLPRHIPLDALLPWMQRDKKVSGGRVRFVLPDRIGHVTVADDVSEAELAEAIDSVQP